MDEIHPHGVYATDHHGRLPLHCDQSYNCVIAEATVRYLLELYQEGAQVADENGDLPLHTACRNEKKSSLHIVQILLQKYQDGSRTINKDGCLPLHVACRTLATLVGVASLMELQSRWSHGARRHQVRENPLALCLRWVDKTQLPLECNPNGSREQDSDGRPTIYHVCDKAFLFGRINNDNTLKQH